MLYCSIHAQITSSQDVLQNSHKSTQIKSEVANLYTHIHTSQEEILQHPRARARANCRPAKFVQMVPSCLHTCVRMIALMPTDTCKNDLRSVSNLHAPHNLASIHHVGYARLGCSLCQSGKSFIAHCSSADLINTIAKKQTMSNHSC